MNLVRLKTLLSFFAIVLIPISAFAEKGNRAVIVIDMQWYFIERGGYADKPENVVKEDQIFQSQVDVIQEAKQKNVPIVFLEYENYGATNDKLKEAATGATDVVYFLKNADGMLDDGNSHKPELVDYLNQKSIETLVVMGANGGACVQRSIQGALDNNLSVVAYDMGIADFNFMDFLYPYDQYYKDSIVVNCKDCTFRETNNVTELFNYEETLK